MYSGLHIFQIIDDYLFTCLFFVSPSFRINVTFPNRLHCHPSLADHRLLSLSVCMLQHMNCLTHCKQQGRKCSCCLHVNAFLINVCISASLCCTCVIVFALSKAYRGWKLQCVITHQTPHVKELL